MLIASKNKSSIDKLKVQLSSKFEIKDLEEPRRILGMKIERYRVEGRVSLTQKAYLQKVLQKFLIGDEGKSVSSPLAPHFKLSARMSPKTIDDREQMYHVPYANAVGSLMYAMVCTRLNLSQTVIIVLRYMHDLGKGHWRLRDGFCDISKVTKKLGWFLRRMLQVSRSTQVMWILIMLEILTSTSSLKGMSLPCRRHR